MTPWTTARQASLSITSSRSLLKLMSMESVMPSNHLILCLPLLLLPSSVFKMVMDREAWWAAVHGVAKDSDATEQLNYNKLFLLFLKYLFTSDSTTNVYFFTNIYFNLSFLASVIISLKDFFFLFFFLSLSPSLACSLPERPVNPRVEVLRQGREFNWGPRRPLASSSK